MNSTFKNWFLTLVLVLLWPAMASAIPTTTVDGITFDTSGSVIKTGPAYLSTNTGNFNPGDVLQAIGKITSIADNTSSVITWQSGDNGRELDFVASGFVVDTVTILGTNRFLTFTGGTINFYSNVDGALNVSAGPAAALASIASGLNFLTTTATTVDSAGTTASSTNSTIGQKNGNGNGYIDVTGGDAAQWFNTNTFLNGFGPNSDMNWFISFAVRSTTPAGFVSDGGVTVLGLSDEQNLPESSTLSLFVIAGLAMMAFRKKRGHKETVIDPTCSLA